MKCSGQFVFRDFTHQDGGTFVNDNGQSIPYSSCYKLKCDERTEDGVKERIFKVAEENKDIIKFCQTLETYCKINIEFDIQLFGSNARLSPVVVKKA